ncbi:MAG: phosphoribosylglycinamide synthetase C domain-containing protein, partial [Methylococcaceae bacterium]
PDTYPKGQVIQGLSGEEPDGIKVFHAGTREDSGQVVTDGGRVLCVCALGEDYADAARLAYARLADIDWESCHYRKDIGHRAMSGSANPA